MRRCADFVVIEFMIAAPDGAAVFVGGMPNLRPKVTAAVSADQPGGEDTVAAVTAPYGLPALQFPLHQLPLGGVDDTIRCKPSGISRALKMAPDSSCGTTQRSW